MTAATLAPDLVDLLKALEERRSTDSLILASNLFRSFEDVEVASAARDLEMGQLRAKLQYAAAELKALQDQHTATVQGHKKAETALVAALAERDAAIDASKRGAFDLVDTQDMLRGAAEGLATARLEVDALKGALSKMEAEQGAIVAAGQHLGTLAERREAALAEMADVARAARSQNGRDQQTIEEMHACYKALADKASRAEQQVAELSRANAALVRQIADRDSSAERLAEMLKTTQSELEAERRDAVTAKIDIHRARDEARSWEMRAGNAHVIAARAAVERLNVQGLG